MRRARTLHSHQLSIEPPNRCSPHSRTIRPAPPFGPYNRITVSFEKRERDGWENECFAPSWFAFDGVPGARPAAASRIGSDAPAILAELGYTAADVERLVASGVAGPTEWFQR